MATWVRVRGVAYDGLPILVDLDKVVSIHPWAPDRKYGVAVGTVFRMDRSRSLYAQRNTPNEENAIYSLTPFGVVQHMIPADVIDMVGDPKDLSEG